MKRITALVAGVLCALMVAGPAAAEDTEADLYGRQVDEAIEKAQKWLLDQQEKSGAWSENEKFWHKYESGVTGVVTYALLKSGISAQNDQLERALAWMAEHPSDLTYELAFRVGCWAATHKQTQGKYRKRMYEDARKLVRGSYGGAYTYEVNKNATRYGEKKKKWDNSNSQYGLLGAWSYHRITNEVPLGYFRLVAGHWHQCQKRNGSWYYDEKRQKDSVTMTAAGLASLFVCYDNLYASRFVDCKGSNVYRRVEEGLKWFSENFQDVGKSKLYYHMYGIERVGLACGYKYFGKGKVDWYKWGVKELLERQRNDGSWKSSGNHSGNDEVATSYALLFLIRGRSPVLFNKLEWNGDWNNRPRDLASVTRWIGDQYEREFAWQIIHANAPVREWHDAQILYISAEKDPDFTDEEIAKLREFVDQGGTIFSVTECGGQGFRKGIRDAYKKMFPKLELTPMGPDHVIYNVYSELKGQPKFYQMTNGLRPLVIHTDVDLAKSWQLQLSGKGSERDFDAAANVYMYVTDLGEVRYRAVSHWPKEKKRSNYREVPVVRIKHDGDWNPEPLSLKRLARVMSVHANTSLEIQEPVTIEKLASSKAKVAFLTGMGKLSLTDAQKRAIVQYVKGGGTLLVDAAGGDEDFARSAARELESALPNSYFVRLLANHDMYQLKDNKIEKIAFRPYRENFRPNRRPGPPRIKAINVDGRPGILLSDEDLTLGLLGVPSYTCDGYMPDSAYRLVRNIVLHADKKSGD